MNTDIRVLTTFPHHHKSKKLRRKLGGDGICALLYLWLFAAENRPDGVLSGMDPDDIAIACQWDGDATSMLQAMLYAGFIELVEGVYVIHDWLENNPWAAAAPVRKAKASAAAKARWDKKNGVGGGEDAAPGENAKGAVFDAHRIVGDARSMVSNAPGNAPSPTPSPSPNTDDDRVSGPTLEDVRSAYNRLCPSLVPSLEISPSSTRWVAVKKLLGKYASHDGGALGFLEVLFARAEASDLIANREGKWRGIPAGLDWLLDENNYIRVLEGFYDNGKTRPNAVSGPRAHGNRSAETGKRPPSHTDASTAAFCARD